MVYLHITSAAGRNQAAPPVPAPSAAIRLAA